MEVRYYVGGCQREDGARDGRVYSEAAGCDQESEE